MERTVQNQDFDKPIRWKKLGGGAFYLNKHIIKPGQVFTARPSSIPQAFRDVCKPLEDIKEFVAPPVEVTKVLYTTKLRGKSKSLFDVIDGNGKVVNEKSMSKEVAEKLANDLSR